MTLADRIVDLEVLTEAGPGVSTSGELGGDNN